jgi:hypothetical protein
MDETKLAEEIVQVLPEGAIRLCSADRDAIRYAVRSRDLKLRTVVLGRQALRRLLHAADGPIKIEYLQRDLLRCAASRAEFAYPRPRVAPRAAGAATTTRAVNAAC